MLGIFFMFGSVTGIFNLRGDHIYGYKKREEEEKPEKKKKKKNGV